MDGIQYLKTTMGSTFASQEQEYVAPLGKSSPEVEDCEKD